MWTQTLKIVKIAIFSKKSELWDANLNLSEKVKIVLFKLCGEKRRFVYYVMMNMEASFHHRI